MLTVKINSHGAELISVIGKEGFEYLWQGKELWHGHAPILFPICGRLKDSKYTYRGKEYTMDIHGIAPYSEFESVNKSDCEITFCLKNTAESEKKYPFKFSIYVTYRIDGNNLRLDFKVNNEGDDILPYMLGWHPGFNYMTPLEAEDYYLSFKEESEISIHTILERKFLLEETRPFPTKKGLWKISNEAIDECDTLLLDGAQGFVSLCTDKTQHKVSVSWSNNIPHLGIWRPAFVNAPFICIEPWSGLPADGKCDEDFETKRMYRLQPHSSESLWCNVCFE
jgi:galactose mutarotase-like enzyme